MGDWPELTREQRMIYFIDDEDRMERDIILYSREIINLPETTLIQLDEDNVYELCSAGGGDEDTEIIYWIAQHAKGRWASPSLGDYWFENPEDAIHFKLRWA
jgi:hypothetical protein